MKHLESALKTKNDWWAYLVVILVAFVLAQLIGSIPVSILVLLKGGIAAAQSGAIDFSAIGVNSSLGLALLVLPFIICFFTLKLLVKPLHNRTLTQVINGRSKVRYGRILYGFLIWGVIIVFSTAVDYYLNINDYELRFEPLKLLLLILVSFLVLPFQTFFEEIFFRGYLAQGIGVLTRSRIAVLIIPSLLFALMHGLNPEVTKHGFWLMMSQYLTIGLVFAASSLLDDGIELAMGAHAANNIFISIFVTTESSALQTDSLLRDLNDVISWSDTLGALLAGAFFIAFFSFKYKWTMKALTKKIEI
nr:type II CAAX endopeptidase family protein [uncultured Carboxylicivirga sp.]